MIAVTGGAGFIGSVLVGELNRRGIDDILIVDHLGTGDKWKNLSGLSFADFIDKSAFLPLLESGALTAGLTAIFHLGACSATTETDASYLMENNYAYSCRIARWWEERGNVRFVYASSAATYGDGAQGYRDDVDELDALRPLHMYGYSKHLFDLTARRNGWLNRCTGLKYFNVYGPNEYHKEGMRSLVCKEFDRVRGGAPLSLFRSDNPRYPDGGQLRDFVYVKDAAAVTIDLASDEKATGLFNVGTGVARSWNDVGRALFTALERPADIAYIDMPERLRGKYQYYTCADTSRLARYSQRRFMTIEEGIGEYVREYLSCGATVASPGAVGC